MIPCAGSNLESGLNFLPNVISYRFDFRTILTEKGKNADQEEYNPFEHRDMENANS